MKSPAPARSLAARTWQRLTGWLGAPGEAPADAPTSAPPRPTLPSHPPGPLRRRTDLETTPSHDSVPEPNAPADEDFDAQTGLATRNRLQSLEVELQHELDRGGLEFSVLRLAVSGLQPVIDRYGAQAGGHVLAQIAKRLRNGARATDRVFRLEGEEFVVLLRCPTGQGAALSLALAGRLVDDLQRPFTYRTLSNLRVQCCAGAAVWPADAERLADAIALAEQALAVARASGEGQVRQHAG